MKPTLLLMLMLLTVVNARAGYQYFDVSLASGTDKLKDVRKAEFLFEEKSDTLRMCGAWIRASGERVRFAFSWGLSGSSVMKDGKSIGSFHEGNFLIEESLGGSRHQAIEVTRENESYFEYHFHHPDLGFVDGDGWIVENPSEILRAECE